MTFLEYVVSTQILTEFIRGCPFGFTPEQRPVMLAYCRTRPVETQQFYLL